MFVFREVFPAVATDGRFDNPEWVCMLPNLILCPSSGVLRSGRVCEGRASHTLLNGLPPVAQIKFLSRQ